MATGGKKIDAFGSWMGDLDALRSEFVEARPFPLLVIDGFLEDGLAERLLDEFPTIEEMPKSRDYVFGDKRELSSLETRGPASIQFYEAMTSPDFATFLSALTGEQIFVDPSFFGGGFHQGRDGGYLDMHVDFNVHPLHATWLRTVNTLLYLNRDWKPEYGGDLLVKASLDESPRAISPLFNRGVIMLTDESTYHGFRKMSLPPDGRRRSIATYGYREIRRGDVRPRTTGWVPEDAPPLKRLFARNYNTLVRVKNRWFGSATSRNR